MGLATHLGYRMHPMSAVAELDQLLRSLEPVRHPGSYVFASLHHGQSIDSSQIVACIREREGMSVVVHSDVARQQGLAPLFVCAWITLNVHSDLQAVGLTAAFSSALGAAGIACNVVAGGFHDHVFVPLQQADAAMDVLRCLQRQALVGGHENPLAETMTVSMLATSDAARYRALMLEAYAQAPDAFTSTPQERAAVPESWWIRRIADPNGMSVVFGAFQGQDLVGAVALEFSDKPKTRHKAHLIGMYVQPVARGTGAARELVVAAMAYLAGRPDIAVVVLTVTEGNTAATRLYRAAGFEAFGTEPMAILTPDGFKAKVHMWCRIGAAPGSLRLDADPGRTATHAP